MIRPLLPFNDFNNNNDNITILLNVCVRDIYILSHFLYNSGIHLTSMSKIIFNIISQKYVVLFICLLK